MNGGAILASTPHLAPTWTRPWLGTRLGHAWHQKFYLWAPKGISSSVITHAPSPPGRMRLTSRQSISPWRVTRRVLRDRSEQQATRRSSRRHRRSTVCAAVPHPSTKLPPRKTARSDALTIEMSALEARPPTAPVPHAAPAPPLGVCVCVCVDVCACVWMCVCVCG
jgi:hypothetical protein